MTSFSKFASVLLFSGLAVAHGAAPASAEGSSALRVEPMKGITLSIGPKRAIGYFTASGGACNLTLMLAEHFSEGWDAVSEPIRVKTVVPAGTTAQIDTLGAGSLAFSCTPGATTMMIQPVERVAYAAPAK